MTQFLHVHVIIHDVVGVWSHWCSDVGVRVGERGKVSTDMERSLLLAAHLQHTTLLGRVAANLCVRVCVCVRGRDGRGGGRQE